MINLESLGDDIVISKTFNLNIYANKSVFRSGNNTRSEIPDIDQTVN